MTEYVRILPELRAAHVERIESWGSREKVLYRSLKWDIGDGADLPTNCARISVRSIAAAARSREVVVEIPEPLWVREIPRSALIVVCFLAFSLGRARFVTYAIENNDLLGLAGRSKWRQLALRLAANFLASRLSRIAYGSETAKTTYSLFPRFRSVPDASFIELPGRVTRAASLVPRAGAIFVGRLETRKGVLELMAAWELVEGTSTHELLIIGDGPLRAQVVRWVDEKPEKRRWIRSIPHRDMDDIYSDHSVLVAPSRREGRWREQIGLPIKEALSHGLTVVTTSETGLADWLDEHGHCVLSNSSPERLSQAIGRALNKPLDPADVVAGLPPEDGRKAADEWLKRLTI